jgi:uncharacterized protein (TIGR02996 family)
VPATSDRTEPPAHDALLQAVIANPADNALRLAYAEWCESAGGEVLAARAEFIRGQITIANTPVEFLQQGWEHARQARLRELHTRYWRAWAEPLLHLVSALEFERGFPAHVKVSAATLLRHGGEIRALAPIEHLDLTAVRDVDETLFAATALTGLRSLGLDGCGLYNIHVRLLAESPAMDGLRWLSLADNHLDLGAAEALAQSERAGALRFAEFRGNPVDPCEQLGWDAGVVVYACLPPEGQALERKYGRLEWLHRPDGPVSRYSV